MMSLQTGREANCIPKSATQLVAQYCNRQHGQQQHCPKLWSQCASVRLLRCWF